MRSLLLKFSLLTVAVAMQLPAADLNLGTWKLDTTKSKYNPGPAPKSATNVSTADGDWVVSKNEGVAADGKATSNSQRYKRDGNQYPWNTTDGTGKTTVSMKQIDDHHTSGTLTRDGKVVSTFKATISKDGKTRTLTSSGTNTDGKKFSNVVVYTRQ